MSCEVTAPDNSSVWSDVVLLDVREAGAEPHWHDQVAPAPGVKAHSFFSTILSHILEQAAFLSGQVSLVAAEIVGGAPHWHDHVAPAPGVKAHSFLSTILLHILAHAAFLAGHTSLSDVADVLEEVLPAPSGTGAAPH